MFALKSNYKPIKIGTTLSNKLANMSLLCSFMVVLIHCYVNSPKGSILWWVTEIIGGGKFGTGGIVRIAVPYFFVAAGFLLATHFHDQNWWKNETKKRIYSLLLPYFIWGIIFGLTMIGFIYLKDGTLPNISYFFRAIGLNINQLPLLAPLWFLRSLFLIVLFSPILYYLASPIGLCGLFIIYSSHVLGFAPFNFLKYTFWDVTISLEGVFYFALGIYLRYHPQYFSRKMLMKVVFPVLGLSLLVGYAILDFKDYVFFKCFKFIAIPFTLVSIWQLIPSIKLPKWLASSAFPIFILHYMLMTFSKPIFSNLHLNLWLYLLFQLSIGFIGSLGITQSIRVFIPQIARLLFGGR